MYPKSNRFSFKNDWKTFEKNNPIIAFIILCNKEKEIYPAYF